MPTILDPDLENNLSDIKSKGESKRKLQKNDTVDSYLRSKLLKTVSQNANRISNREFLQKVLENSGVKVKGVVIKVNSHTQVNNNKAKKKTSNKRQENLGSEPESVGGSASDGGDGTQVAVIEDFRAPMTTVAQGKFKCDKRGKKFSTKRKMRSTDYSSSDSSDVPQQNIKGHKKRLEEPRSTSVSQQYVKGHKKSPTKIRRKSVQQSGSDLSEVEMSDSALKSSTSTAQEKFKSDERGKKFNPKRKMPTNDCSNSVSSEVPQQNVNGHKKRLEEPRSTSVSQSESELEDDASDNALSMQCKSNTSIAQEKFKSDKTGQKLREMRTTDYSSSDSSDAPQQNVKGRKKSPSKTLSKSASQSKPELLEDDISDSALKSNTSIAQEKFESDKMSKTLNLKRKMRATDYSSSDSSDAPQQNIKGHKKSPSKTLSKSVSQNKSELLEDDISDSALKSNTSIAQEKFESDKMSKTLNLKRKMRATDYSSSDSSDAPQQNIKGHKKSPSKTLSKSVSQNKSELLEDDISDSALKSNTSIAQEKVKSDRTGKTLHLKRKMRATDYSSSDSSDAPQQNVNGHKKSPSKTLSKSVSQNKSELLEDDISDSALKSNTSIAQEKVKSDRTGKTLHLKRKMRATDYSSSDSSDAPQQNVNGHKLSRSKTLSKPVSQSKPELLEDDISDSALKSNTSIAQEKVKSDRTGKTLHLKRKMRATDYSSSDSCDLSQQNVKRHKKSPAAKTLNKSVSQSEPELLEDGSTSDSAPKSKTSIAQETFKNDKTGETLNLKRKTTTVDYSSSDSYDVKRHKSSAETRNKSASQSESVLLDSALKSHTSIADSPELLQTFKHENQLNNLSVNREWLLSDLSENDDIFYVQVPKNLHPNLLIDNLVSLADKTKFKIGDKTYIWDASNEDVVSNVIVGPAADSKYCVKHLNCKQIIVQEQFKSRRAPIESQPLEEVVLFPENLRSRHPLFGTDYSDKIQLNESVMQKLVNIPRRREKRRNRKKTTTTENIVHSQQSMEHNLCNLDVFKILNEHSSTEINYMLHSNEEHVHRVKETKKRREKFASSPGSIENVGETRENVDNHTAEDRQKDIKRKKPFHDADGKKRMEIDKERKDFLDDIEQIASNCDVSKKDRKRKKKKSSL